MSKARVDEVLKLSDGRDLGWAEFGDPEGRPLMFFHGLPGSRYLSGILDADAREVGVRLIGTDRPGFGRSSLKTDRKFGDWPSDVAELADHLGIDKFFVSGISGGGAYTLATAHALGGRVLAAGVISGGGDISTPEALEGMHAENRGIFELAKQGPDAVEAAMAPMLEALQSDAESAFEAGIEGLPPADQELLRTRPDIKEVMKTDGREAMREGAAGAAYEAWLYIQPWDFNVAEIKPPVVFWHGDDDRNAPLSHAQKLADQIPHSELVVWTGMGHLTAAERGEEILQKLVSLA